ncbi:hypothetical protein TNCV_2304861 [Trichonephila clavipes]|nr:hypothetical protein TNCV_2304861 [Trichonephila clavipes]
MDLVILSHGQVTRTTPELAHPSANFPASSPGGHLRLDRFNVHRPSTRQGLQAGTGLEIITRQPRVRYLDL